MGGVCFHFLLATMDVLRLYGDYNYSYVLRRKYGVILLFFALNRSK